MFDKMALNGDNFDSICLMDNILRGFIPSTIDQDTEPMKTSNRSCLALFSISLLFFIFLPAALTAAEKEYRYQEQKGKDIMPFTWKIDHTGDTVRISVFKNGNSYISTSTMDGSTRHWQLSDIRKGDFEAQRVDNIVTINGKLKGEPYENAVGLNDMPWLQSLYHALGSFINSPYRDLTFWTIQEGELVPVILKARKRGSESVTVNGQRVMTQKIEVSSDDFFSRLWRGFYWFRDSDKLLVKYLSDPGIPGATQTVVTLVSGPSE